MAKRMANRRIAWLLVLGVAGCTSSSNKATCDDDEAAARDKVEHAITSNVTCTMDSDCAVISFAASCFDSCSAVVAKTGMAAVQAAIDSVNANECKAASDDGCVITHPPCAPPQAATCAAGTCK